MPTWSAAILLQVSGSGGWGIPAASSSHSSFFLKATPKSRQRSCFLFTFIVNKEHFFSTWTCLLCSSVPLHVPTTSLIYIVRCSKPPPETEHCSFNFRFYMYPVLNDALDPSLSAEGQNRRAWRRERASSVSASSVRQHVRVSYSRSITHPHSPVVHFGAVLFIVRNC